MKFLHEMTALSSLLVCFGCTGVLGEGEGRDGGRDGTATNGRGEGAGASEGTGASPELDGTLGVQTLALRRLTQSQYRNIVSDTFGDDFARGVDLERDYYDEGFASVGARQVAVSRLGVSKYETAAIAVAEAAGSLDRYVTLSGCGAGDFSQGCLDAFVREVGEKLFRRPLSAVELTRYTGIFGAAEGAGAEPTQAIQTILTGLLLSPNFLYHHEEANGAGGDAKLSALALASKISFLLWDSGPDAALVQAATSGALETNEQLEAQIERLVSDKLRLTRGVEAFAQGYLALHRLADSTKDPVLFPEFTEELMSSMRTAALLSVEDVVVTRDESFDRLITQTSNFVDANLAAHTGATVTDVGFSRFDYGPDSLRGGLLTEPAIMAITSRAFDTSPTLRGLFVRELLCDEVPPPPPNVSTALPEPTMPLTRRDEFELHMSEPTCNGCHALMDPPGFALEYFDPMGRLRELDSGLPIDGSGTLDGVAFDGPRELARAVVELPRFRECLTEKLLTHALGYPLHDKPGNALDEFVEGLNQDSGRLVALLRLIALSDEFRAAPLVD